MKVFLDMELNSEHLFIGYKYFVIQISVCNLSYHILEMTLSIKQLKTEI